MMVAVLWYGVPRAVFGEELGDAWENGDGRWWVLRRNW